MTYLPGYAIRTARGRGRGRRATPEFRRLAGLAGGGQQAERRKAHVGREYGGAAGCAGVGGAGWHHPAAGRQVDLAPRPHAGGAGRWRDQHRGPARGRRHPRHGRGHARLRRHRHPFRPWRLAGQRAGRRRPARAREGDRLRQCRHRRAPGHGHRRQPRLRHHLHRRRLAGEAADGPRPRSAAPHGRPGHRPLRRPPAADRARAGRRWCRSNTACRSPRRR